MRSRPDEGSYKVEMSHHVVSRNRVHLQKTNEPSPPSSDPSPAEVSGPLFLQSNELSATLSGEVNPPASSRSRKCSRPLRRPEVASFATELPSKPVLKPSERQQRLPKHFSDLICFD